MNRKEYGEWRNCLWLLDKIDVRAKEKAKEYTDTLELPKTREGWQAKLAIIFHQAYDAAMREHDVLQLAMRKRIDPDFDDSRELADACECKMSCNSISRLDIKKYLCDIGVDPNSLPKVRNVLQCRGYVLEPDKNNKYIFHTDKADASLISGD